MNEENTEEDETTYSMQIEFVNEELESRTIGNLSKKEAMGVAESLKRQMAEQKLLAPRQVTETDKKTPKSFFEIEINSKDNYQYQLFKADEVFSIEISEE